MYAKIFIMIRSRSRQGRRQVKAAGEFVIFLRPALQPALLTCTSIPPNSSRAAWTAASAASAPDFLAGADFALRHDELVLFYK